MNGPAWMERKRSAMPAAHIPAAKFTRSASPIRPNRSTPLPSTFMPAASPTPKTIAPVSSVRLSAASA